MKKFDVYVFDCDGTMFDTNIIILDAFKSVASHYCSQEKLHEFESYIRENAGISRLRIFKKLYEICECNLFSPEDFVETCSKVYDNIKTTNVVSAMIIPGLHEYVESLGTVPKMIVSGGSKAAINRVLEKHDLRSFDEVKGSEKPKEEHFKEISRQFPGKSLVYFGDSKHDYESSKDYVDQFVFVSGYTMMNDPEYFDEKDVITISDYVELLNDA